MKINYELSRISNKIQFWRASLILQRQRIGDRFIMYRVQIALFIKVQVLRINVIKDTRIKQWPDKKESFSPIKVCFRIDILMDWRHEVRCCLEIEIEREAEQIAALTDRAREGRKEGRAEPAKS